jgi:hypothetical protein
MIHSVYLARAAYVAAALEISDRLKDKPQTIAELATATETHERSLFRIMRLLAGYNFYREDAEGRYHLAKHGKSLLSDDPQSSRWWTLSLGDELWKSNSCILESVKTGETGFKIAHGTSVWDWYPQHPREHDIFIWGMNGFTEVHCSEVVQAFDFSRFRKVVDVGGGGGVLIREILKATPNLEGVLFDQPRTVEEAAPRLVEAGLADRSEAVGGNFLKELPSGADAYIFKHVLRDWSDDNVKLMLRNCHRAMDDSGTLLVIDALVDPKNGTDRLLKLVDVQMMVDGGGGLRTLDTFKQFFRECGFELVKVHRTTIIDMNIIEARRLDDFDSSSQADNTNEWQNTEFDPEPEAVGAASNNYA